MISLGVGFQIKSANASTEKRLVMSESECVVLCYINIFSVDCSDVCGRDAAREVVIRETVVGEIILLERRASERDADRSGVDAS